MNDIRNKRRKRSILLILFVMLLFCIWIDLNSGYKEISVRELIEIILGGGEKSTRYTLLHLRLPRVLTSLLVGIGLSLSGCILQCVTRNDMAEPGILGINAGAGLFVAVFLVLIPHEGVSLTLVLPFLAFAGSLAVAFADYRLALIRGRLSARRLLLVGIAISTAVSSATTMLMLRMSDSEYAFVQNWLSGSIWGASWANVRLLAAALFLLCLFTFFKGRTLDVLALGEQTAVGLGVSVSAQTVLMIGVSLALSSLCCAVGGGLSFVGLVCPHLARRLIGPRLHTLIPACILTGAVLMTLSDIISRTLLSPNEIPVGIVAAVIGAPYFLYLLVRR